MSDFDRNASAQWGTSVGRAGTVEIDQGLRAYMLGVYNYMTIGLGITGLAALATNMAATTTNAAGKIALTPLGQALYQSPLNGL